MPLFHPKIIKNLLSSPVLIPDEHRQILQNWSQSIHDGTIYRRKETELEGLFRDQIITKVLGYKPFSGANNYDVYAQFPIAGNRVDLALGNFDPHDNARSECRAVLELKGAKTKLDAVMPGRNKTPVQQAWDYAIDVKGASWVLVSNYIEIRLYAFGNGRQEFERFAFETLLEPENYTRFIKILSRDSLLGDFTPSLLEQSAAQDKDVTERLYQDYKILRHNLISHIRTHNETIDQISAVSYAQTILDRVLFVAFAEDKGLLPESSLKKAYEYKDPYSKGRTVWDTFKDLFRSIDEGNPQLGIPGYNGGLFKDAADINALKLPDTIFQGFKALGEYHFDTEVSVNILGHIFEQSISDIEALQKGLSDLSVKTKDGKRKKEGVVYTPSFVTRYIVEETLGGYLKKKRDSLNDAHPEWYNKSGDKKGEFKTEKAEIEFWREWQNILKSVKIVDPACGSGAFLIAAFDYLHEDYTKTNSRLSDLLGSPSFFDPDRDILINNLFGVDLNSESIEITKLSLWLKTAKRGKTLNTLDNNFRWGDSLIEDSNYSARAFTWKDAFPDIFAAGGFDVVLGNPPYVRQEFLSDFKPYLEKRFAVYSGTIDLYAYFFELGLRILKTGGRMGYICSSTFFKTGSGETLRGYLTENATQNAMIDFGDLQIFEGVTTYPAILIMTKQLPPESHEIPFLNVRSIPNDLSHLMRNDAKLLPQRKLGKTQWQLESKDLSIIRKKITEGRKTLKEVYGSPLYGIKTGLNEAFVIDRKTRDSLVRQDPACNDLSKPFLEGKDLQKWHKESRDLFLILMPKGFTKSKIGLASETDAWSWLEKNYPSIANHLKPFAEACKKRCDKGDYWWELRACDYYKEFEKPKIVWGNLQNRPSFYLDTKGFFINAPSPILSRGDNFVLGYLNSALCWFTLSDIAIKRQGGFLEAKPIYINQLPIPDIDEKQSNILGNLATQCQQYAEDRYAIQSRVRGRMTTDLSNSTWDGKLGKALGAWWNLSFQEIQSQIKKIFKREIPILERDDWESYLAQERDKLAVLTDKIRAAEQEIDALVYRLFDLTNEEITLIEENIHGS